MKTSISTSQAKRLITDKLSHFFGVSPSDATDEQFYKAVAMIVRDRLSQQNSEFRHIAKGQDSKQIYYLCMEFLMGRSLKNNLYNLGLISVFNDALASMGVKLDNLYELEPDAGLGNGGLGRLAACYLDGLATDGFQSMGYSLRYEAGIFKQKLIDGWQTELPDFWLPGGEVWLVPREERSCKVYFEGHIEDSWDGDFHHVAHKDANIVEAVPYDMYVSGKGEGVSRLRLWAAKKPELDMTLFNEGSYMKAMEQSAMAEAITKILYPADNSPEGKSLRLRQQYFLVSASIQDIIQRHLTKYGTLDNLPDKVAIHINDTHPTMAIPELMRIMLDECGYGWDDAWSIVSRTVAYTNHTVMKEALECWSEELYSRLLPRIYQIVEEINRRFVLELTEKYGNNPDKIRKMAIIADGQIRMAFLAIVGSHSVNGVAALHTEILKKQELHDFYELYPEKFNNKTNGITQRRWLLHANPKLAELITETIGKGWITNLDELKKLVPYAENAAFRSRFTAIKKENKIALAQYIKETKGIDINPDSIFDIQVKRLHEYKRQLLNILHVIGLYNHLKMNPGLDMIPRTFIFGAKAAAGYHRAKLIIKLINAVADVVNNDPTIHGKIKVVFMENYRVSLAEKMIPAADVSEQISTAGKEASGTGNMKFMLNGALTIGTMDGANVEICEEVGRDNIFIFGMSAAEVQQKTQEGYDPWMVYNMNQEVRMALTSLIDGTFDPDTNLFRELYDALLNGCGGRADEYFVLEDYADYARAQWDIDRAYRDEEKWVRMAILNTAESGKFSSDRTIRQYADEIWQLPSVEIV